MNRRNFLSTVGSIATVGTATALAGCTATSGNPNNSTDGNATATPSQSQPGNADQTGTPVTDAVKIIFHATKSFNETAEYRDVTLTEYTNDDGEEYLTLQYILDIQSFEEKDCSDVEVTIEVYDENDVVLDTLEFISETYDTGKSYKVEHDLPFAEADVSRIEATFNTDELGLSCGLN